MFLQYLVGKATFPKCIKKTQTKSSVLTTIGAAETFLNCMHVSRVRVHKEAQSCTV